MRLFVVFLPTNVFRWIDINDDLTVDDLLESVRREFGFNVQPAGPQERVLVLNYNGCDLKPKWLLSDLSIASGSILRCLFRKCPTPFLHVHCSYTRKILKFYESAIHLKMTVGEVRTRIANELGIPLSLFCLESFDGSRRFYDESRLIDYEITVYDHIFLKVWKDQEKFVNSCLKGFTENFSNDELFRHYQAQVALHIASFHGHLELAKYALQIGARADRPTGEHPSRQWSAESLQETLPQALKCPIHIAIERGHYKIVSLLVRNSISCTQVIEPISRFLPYRLALDRGFRSKKREEKQNLNAIYFLLFSKQYNMRIPLNSTSEHVAEILTPVGDNYLYSSDLSHFVTISVPFYCRLIRWVERARLKVWSRFDHRTSNPVTKKIYPENGVLGYPILIDGFNNNYEATIDPSRAARANSVDPTEHTSEYGNFSNDERMKIYLTKRRIKNFLTNDRTRQRQSVAMYRRRATVVAPQRMSITNQTTTLKSVLKQGSFLTKISEVLQEPKPQETPRKALTINVEQENSTSTERFSYKSRARLSMPTIQRGSLSNICLSPAENRATATSDNQLALSSSKSLTSSKTKTREEDADDVSKSDRKFFPRMSAADIYFLSTSKLNPEEEKRKSAEKIERIFPEPAKSTISESSSVEIKLLRTVDPQTLLEKECRLALREGSTPVGPRPIKSRFDHQIHKNTMKVYENYSEVSTRDSVIEVLEEAAHFKGKSWLKQVEISKQMIKNQVQSRIRRSNEQNRRAPSGPVRASSSISVTKTKPIEVR